MTDRYVLRQHPGAGATRSDVESAIVSKGHARIIDAGPRYFLIAPLNDGFRPAEVFVFDGWTVSRVETVARVPDTRSRIEAPPNASRSKASTSP